MAARTEQLERERLLELAEEYRQKGHRNRTVLLRMRSARPERKIRILSSIRCMLSLLILHRKASSNALRQHPSFQTLPSGMIVLQKIAPLKLGAS